MKVLMVEDSEGEKKVTLEREDGKRFVVNIPDECWSKEKEPCPHGLNLMFGNGEHYG